MCETHDMRVAAAGATVLNSAMALARRKSTPPADEPDEQNSGDGGGGGGGGDGDGRALKVSDGLARRPHKLLLLSCMPRV